MAKANEEEQRARRELYESYRASGLTLREYCETQKVCVWKMKYAVKVYGRSERERAPVSEFQEVAIKRESVTGEFTVQLRNGRSVKIPPQFQDSALLKLIGVLESC